MKKYNVKYTLKNVNMKNMHNKIVFIFFFIRYLETHFNSFVRM